MLQFLLFIFVFNFSLQAQEKISTLVDCELPTCQQKCLYSTTGFIKENKAYNDDKAGQIQESEYEFTGKSDLFGETESVIAKAKVFVGGLTDCVDIPFLGFHDGGKPVIKTNKGKLYLTETDFNFCENCVVFIDPKTSRVLKSFNLVQFDIDIIEYKFSKDQKLYKAIRGTCFEISNNKLYETMDPKVCYKFVAGKKLELVESPLNKDKPKEKLIPKYPRHPSYGLYRSADLDYLIYAMTFAPVDS